MKGHLIVAHPADVGFTATGETFLDLLDEVVAALAEVESGGDLPSATERRPLPETEGEPEDRVVRVLEHCLFLLDTEDWLAVGVRTDGASGDGASGNGVLCGAALSAEARAEGTHVKAITWHQLAVVQDADGWRATVFVDL